MVQPGYVRLIGTPYKILDCWGIAREFYRIELAMELKRYYDHAPNDIEVANKLIFTNIGDFEQVTAPRFGDIVLININGIEAHIGIYINEQQILHTMKLQGCVLDRLSRWEKMVVGYYRVKKL